MSKSHHPLEGQQLPLIADEQTTYTIAPQRGDTLKVYSKESLVNELRKIRDIGWIPNARPGNAGGIGNTLEDLLGIEENNLPIPNAAEWELKCHRMGSTALVTLFHLEPSPRALKFVPRVFLPLYGWPHQEAGGQYGPNEMSFRQTISGCQRSDRGFTVAVDRIQGKVLISFDKSFVEARHMAWLNFVEQRVGLGELDPQPYWGFDDLRNTAGTKLLNSFYVQVETKREGIQEYFRYSDIMILQRFSIDGLISGIEQGHVYIDFDARTGHNHGTKFRMRQDKLPLLYSQKTEV